MEEKIFIIMPAYNAGATVEKDFPEYRKK